MLEKSLTNVSVDTAATAGQVDVLPYYLLIVGSPDRIPKASGSKLEKAGLAVITPITEPTSAQVSSKRPHFDGEIIVLCVRWHPIFKHSSRELFQ
jgi:hypothetical protein